MVFVPSTLGSGAHGLIGINLSPITYATLTPFQQFFTSAHPGLLLNNGGTQYGIGLARTLREKALNTY